MPVRSPGIGGLLTGTFSVMTVENRRAVSETYLDQFCVRCRNSYLSFLYAVTCSHSRLSSLTPSLSAMAPSAIFYPPSTAIQEPSPTMAIKGSALVIGSLSTAQDGRYQSVLQSLEHRDVERQLVDRLVDGGMLYIYQYGSQKSLQFLKHDLQPLHCRLAIFLPCMSFLRQTNMRRSLHVFFRFFPHYCRHSLLSVFSIFLILRLRFKIYHLSSPSPGSLLSPIAMTTVLWSLRSLPSPKELPCH